MTEPTDCQQAVDANLKIIEINRNIKQDYDNRVATAYNNWQASLNPGYRENFINNLRNIYNSGYYVLQDYRKTGGSPVENEAFQLSNISSVQTFYRDHVAYGGELKNCNCGGGCCWANAPWCQKCCAMAWRPNAMNSKNFTCGDCGIYGCGDWWKDTSRVNPTPDGTPQFLEYLVDTHFINRLSTNLFEPYFVREYERHARNFENIYRNIAPPVYMPTFDITCCQTILGSNINANASNITFDPITNICHAETTDIITTTSSSTSSTTSSTTSTTAPITILTIEQIGQKINELPQDQQIGLWIGVSISILLIIIGIVYIGIAIKRGSSNSVSGSGSSSSYSSSYPSTYSSSYPIKNY